MSRSKKKSSAGKSSGSRRTPYKIAQVFDVPASVMPGVFRLEMSGNREAVVEGCKGILEYDSDSIKISVGKSTALRFYGEKLLVKTMREETIVLVGEMVSVEFLREEK